MYFIVIFFSYNIFGFEDKTIAWFNSYLTGRSQRVKIGDKKSSSQNLLSGVPQGGILSPLVFVIYVFDLSDWLKSSIAAHIYFWKSLNTKQDHSWHKNKNGSI